MVGLLLAVAYLLVSKLILSMRFGCASVMEAGESCSVGAFRVPIGLFGGRFAIGYQGVGEDGFY